LIVFDIVGETEKNPIYQDLQAANIERQYSFLRSLVLTAVKTEKPFLSQHILKALNFHAITCLHTNAGEYRPCEVTVGAHRPAAHYRVSALMDDFTNTVNRLWGDNTDAIDLAAYVLWRLNYSHPFINGNGRTARAACHYVICVHAGGWLPGTPILPELIREKRDSYVQILRDVDDSYHHGALDLSALSEFIAELIEQQIDNI
jgi:Fic family protein